MNAAIFSVLLNAAEQHGFPHTPQADEQKALVVATLFHPIERDGRPFDEEVSSGQFRRRSTGARGIWIDSWIHVYKVYPSLWFFHKLG